MLSPLPVKIEEGASCLLPQSRKIQKRKKVLSEPRVPKFFAHDNSFHNVINISNEGYNTYSHEERKDILDNIKQKLEKFIGYDLTISPELQEEPLDYLECLDEVGPETFNEFIKNEIPRYRPNLILNTHKLTQLRRQIRNWMMHEGQPETRGCALIPCEELPKFLEDLKSVIRGMETRSFKELRKRILPVIAVMQQKLSRDFSENMFSKHYWSNFKCKYPDIKQLWNSLPHIRSKELPPIRSPSKIQKQAKQTSSQKPVKPKSQPNVDDLDDLCVADPTITMTKDIFRETLMKQFACSQPLEGQMNFAGFPDINSIINKGIQVFPSLNPTVIPPAVSTKSLVKEENMDIESSMQMLIKKEEEEVKIENPIQKMLQFQQNSGAALDPTALNSLLTMMNTFDFMSYRIKQFLTKRIYQNNIPSSGK